MSRQNRRQTQREEKKQTMITSTRWSDLSEALDSGAAVEVSMEVFNHYLDQQPPVNEFKQQAIPGHGLVTTEFGFTKGAEPTTYFWRALDSGWPRSVYRWSAWQSKEITPHSRE